MNGVSTGEQSFHFAQFESLSQRGREVFAALTTGMPEREIASLLGISPNTVHGHVKQIYRMMRLHSRESLFNAVRGDANLSSAAERIFVDLKARTIAAPATETGAVQITLRVERPILAALNRHVDNLPRHLAELLRREAERLSQQPL